MVSGELRQELENFFASYRSAFNHGNAVAIAEHYVCPAQFVADSGQVTIAVAESLDKLTSKMDELLEMYRQVGFRRARVRDLTVAGLSPRMFRATVRWGLHGERDELLYDFDTSYVLARVSTGLRITSTVSHNELVRHREFREAQTLRGL